MSTTNSGSNDSSLNTMISTDVNRLAKPLYLQRLENALRLDGLIAQVDRTLNDNRYDFKYLRHSLLNAFISPIN